MTADQTNTANKESLTLTQKALGPQTGVKLKQSFGALFKGEFRQAMRLSNQAFNGFREHHGREGMMGMIAGPAGVLAGGWLHRSAKSPKLKAPSPEQLQGMTIADAYRKDVSDFRATISHDLAYANDAIRKAKAWITGGEEAKQAPMQATPNAKTNAKNSEAER